MNALTPSLDATSLEIFEVLVRGSGQLLISKVKKCEPVKVGESASQSEEIIEIDDFDKWSDRWFRRLEQYYKAIL